VLNAANEEAVAALLDHRLEFAQIPGVIEAALAQAPPGAAASVDEALSLDRNTRILVRESILGSSAS
jgi:1-deoxy-D-xylulose-5-phosphate reductoisomerase